MMTERQRKFREKYVAEISPWYNGLLHIGVTYGGRHRGDRLVREPDAEPDLGVAADRAGGDRRQLRRVGACTST